MRDEPIEAWKNKIRWYLENNHLKDLNRIDGKPTEFEWKIFPGFTTLLGLLEEIQKLMKDLQCEPEQFNDRIIFMSVYNVYGDEKGNTEGCEKSSQTVANCARRFRRGHSWDVGQKRNGTELTLINTTELGTKLPNK